MNVQYIATVCSAYILSITYMAITVWFQFVVLQTTLFTVIQVVVQIELELVVIFHLASYC